jgi:23S rRNA (guanosine2251-2'-O)-methyltransferase
MAAGRRKIFHLYISSRPSDRIKRITTQAGSHHIPIETLSADRLQALAGTPSHQGICARVGGFVFSDMDKLLSHGQSGLILVLDGLQDPRNVGALIRTAVCAGADGIILPKNRSASLTPSVAMTSAGAVEHIRMVRVTNISRALEQLKSAGIWVAGLVPVADESIFEADLSGPLALVIGGEEKGVRPLVQQNCDFLVSIPQKGRIDSLNASVAGAVALYEAFRQRQVATEKTDPGR